MDSPGKQRRAPARLMAAGLPLAAVGMCLASAQGVPRPATSAAHDAQAQQQAAALLRAQQYPQALRVLAPALRLHPDSPQLLTIQGVAFSLQGNDAAALKALRHALRADATFVPAMQAEAEVLVREHSPEVVAVLERILAVAPGDQTARAMLASQQAEQGDCADAVSNFAALADPQDSGAEPSVPRPALQQNAGCLYTLGRYSEAAGEFSRLLQQNPSSSTYRYNLGLAQLRAGDAAESARTLQPLVAQQAQTPPGEDTLSLASDAEEAAGNTPDAVALLRRAIVLEPTLSDSYVRFAELCMAHESYRPGIDMVSSGLARMPHSPALYLARGMLYGGEGSYAAAEADFRSAEMYDPAHGTGDYGVGIVQLQSNHPDAALVSTRAALRRHPDDPRLNLLLARILLEQDAAPGSAVLAEASTAAANAVRLDPSIVAAHTLLAKADMLGGRTEAAAADCRAALKLDPDDQTALYRLMLVSRKLGDTATAHALAQRVAAEHQQERDAQSERLRYRLVETPPTAAH